MKINEFAKMLNKNALTTNDLKTIIFNDYEDAMNDDDDENYDFDPLELGYDIVLAIAKFYGTPIPSECDDTLKFDVNGLTFEIYERFVYKAVPKKYIYRLAYAIDDESVNQYDPHKRFSWVKALKNTNPKYF